MACDPISNLTGCLSVAAAGQQNAANPPGWEGICLSFAKAAQQLLDSFARSFTAIPPVDLTVTSVRSVYGLSLEIAALVAAVLLLTQVIRTAVTHDGSPIAQGLLGVGKAALAFVLTLAVAATALRAADELTTWIVVRSFGSTSALSAHLAGLASFNQNVSPSLTLIMAVLGIVLTIALWAQLLARGIAVTVLVAVSPLAAAGQVGNASQQWWRKLAKTTVQLIALKPVVALILAIGLTVPSPGTGVEKLLAGLLVLLLAGCAWPAMARAAAVLEVHVTGGTLAGVRGADTKTGAGQPGGVDPAELSRIAEARTMAVVHELRAGADRRLDVTRLARTSLPARAQPKQAKPGQRPKAAAGDGSAR
ncbi:MAG TPA: hypothetical protein VMA95_11725 [Streptosporangiaceae bacterium]|nr:hypothetical protein [Streptosporangiaceae bacterium]